MAGTNINAVLMTGNLTRDPELRELSSGSHVCSMRLACNGRVKRDNEWVDKPNFFDVSVFGNLAVACNKHLAKGRPVAISGRLDWREWETDSGDKRQAVQIIAEGVQFLPHGDRSDSNDGGGSPAAVSAAADQEDDIPF